METRARYALIGLFMLAALVASFGFVYWLENAGGFGERQAYRIRFQSSVSGLAGGIGGAVQRHQGWRGHRPCAHSAEPGQVTATVAVVRGTPIRADTEVNVRITSD